MVSDIPALTEERMKITGRHILIISIIIAFGVNAQTGDLREKAKYYFMQGSLEAASKDLSSAYEYYKKAYTLDSTYADAAFNYASQRLFMQTDTLQKEKERKRSLEMMQRYVDQYPEDLYATELYGYVTTRMDTVSEAIRVYERAYELMPKQTQLLLNLADSYMMNNEPRKAISALDKYELIDGKSANLSLKKVGFYLTATDTVGALKEVENLIEAKPGDYYSRILKGNLYEVIGKPDSVLAAYKEAERIAPESGAVKMSLANYYRSVGDSVMLDNQMYDALLSDDIVFDDKMQILGDYLQKLIDEKGDKSRGDHLFSVLMKQYPHEPGLLDMSARYSGAKGEFGVAAEEISYAIDLDATNETYWLMLLNYLIADSKYEEVVKSYQKSKESIEPTLSMKHLYAGAATMMKDSIDGKKIMTELIGEYVPEDVAKDEEKKKRLRKELNYDELVWVSTMYSMLGDLDHKTGNSEDSFKAYEESLFYFPDNALALNNYAYFLSEEDRELEKAKKMSRRSLDLSENNPTYIDTYAWILYKLGDYSEAMDYIKLAIDLAKEAGEEDNEEYHQHFEAIQKAWRGKEGNEGD